MYYQDLYTDLNASIECKIEVESELTVGQVILTVNGVDIIVDDSTAEKIFEAVKIRSLNKIKAEENDFTTDFLIRQDEERQQIKREEM